MCSYRRQFIVASWQCSCHPYVCPRPEAPSVTTHFYRRSSIPWLPILTTLKVAWPLVISVAVVSLLFAAYQVRTERKNLRADLSRRAELLADSLQESIEPQFEKNERAAEKTIQRVVDRFTQREHMRGIAVYQAD